MVVEVPILEVLEVFNGFCKSLKIWSGGNGSCKHNHHISNTATFSGKLVAVH